MPTHAPRTGIIKTAPNGAKGDFMNKNIKVPEELNSRLKAVADRTGLKQTAIIIRGIEIAVDILEKENGFMATGKISKTKRGTK